MFTVPYFQNFLVLLAVVWVPNCCSPSWHSLNKYTESYYYYITNILHKIESFI